MEPYKCQVAFSSATGGRYSGVCRRIYDRLTNRLQRERVFFDVDNIEPGLDFVKILSNRSEFATLLSWSSANSGYRSLTTENAGSTTQ